MKNIRTKFIFENGYQWIGWNNAIEYIGITIFSQFSLGFFCWTNTIIIDRMMNLTRRDDGILIYGDCKPTSFEFAVVPFVRCARISAAVGNCTPSRIFDTSLNDNTGL